MKFACVALLCLALASTVSAQTAAPAAAPASLADALNAAPNNTLSTLKAALDAAGLTPALRNTSLVWTVFAPTNQAFAAAIAALGTTASALLANQELLTTILSYHVVPGVAALSTDLTDGQMLPTLLGPELMVSLANGNVTIVGAGSNATVTAADIAAGSSVVHVIDAVLIPPMNGTDMDSEDGMSTAAAGTTTSTAAGSTAGSSAAGTAGTASPPGTAAPLSGSTTTTGANEEDAAAAPVATSAAQPMASLGLVSGAAAAIAVLGSLLL